MPRDGAGRFAEHDSVITNPNNPAFEIQNFADVRRDLVSAFAVVNTEVGSASWEAGLRYAHVATDAGEVSATGMMAMMGMNAQALADRFNAADRSLNFDNVDAVVKFAYQDCGQVSISAPRPVRRRTRSSISGCRCRRPADWPTAGTTSAISISTPSGRPKWP